MEASSGSFYGNCWAIVVLQTPIAIDERRKLQEKITKRLVQSFCKRFNIVSRRQCGKLMLSPVKEEKMEREVAYHLGPRF